MNSRERVNLALKHKEPDTVPIHDTVWQATIDRWRTEGLPPGVLPADYFGFELAGFWADSSPRYPIEIIRQDNEFIVERDSFGQTRKNYRDFSTTPMIIDYACKNRNDWKKIKSNLKADYYRVDWVSSYRSFQRQQSLGKFIVYEAVVGYEKILRYMAPEQLLKLVLTDPEWVKDMYLTDAKLSMKMCDLMMDAGFVFDGAFLYCDLGYRKGLMFSPKHYEEQLNPVFKELCSYFHNKKMPVILHSDGQVKDLIPLFIEAGIDCLQPLEVKAKMDVIDLKSKYGDKISFMGGIDVRLMELEDLKPLEKEIKKKITAAKEGGGYIYHSDHSIPKNVGFKHYRKIIDLVKKYGKY